MLYKILLAVLLVLVIAILLWGYLNKSSKYDVDEAKFEELSKEPDAVVIDVRTEGEFRKGRIPSAILINANPHGFKEQVSRLDKNKTYLIYCRSGSSSRAVCTVMADLGFGKLYNLKNGIKGWEKNGKQVLN